MIKEEFIVDGMMCANCKATVEETLRKTKGVISASVNLASKRARVIFDDKIASIDILFNKVNDEGFKCINLDDKEKYELEKRQKLNKSKIKLIICLILGLIELYASMGVMLGLPFIFTNNYILYFIIQLIIIVPIIILNFNIIKKGIFNLFRWHPSMESLVSIGVLASFIYSFISFINYFISFTKGSIYLDSVSTILVLIELGKYLETKSLNKASEALSKLMDMTPKKCIILKDNKEEIISINDVKINDILVVKPGDNIAVDGIVVKDNSLVNEASLTGESKPINKEINSKVFAGTNNINSVLYYQALAVGKDTEIAKIIKLVEETQGSKAPIESLTDKVASVFTKTVLSIALLAFIIWLIIKKDFSFSFNIFVSVLVIACPCSLGLATPTSIIVGSSVGAKNGIIYKDAKSLESLGKLDTFFFDKTGTLTDGKFSVVKIETNHNESEFMELVGSLESKSNHLIATSIIKYNKQKNYKLYDVKEYKENSGIGVEGIIKNKKVRIEKSTKHSNKETIIDVYINDKLEGSIYLSDQIKEDAKKLIDYLKNNHKEVIILSGDNKESTEFVAKTLGINKYYSKLMPVDKQNIIKEYKKNHKVGMVGDGINDSIALSEADVSISLNSSTDIALSCSNIVIVSNKLTDIINAIRLSNKTFKHIKQNLFFAFFYNTLGISLASGLFYFLGILLNPMIGALAMSFSSVSVVSNALRINTFKKGEY